MTLLFRNKYRIPSARDPNHDYGSEGIYFITICIEKGKKVLSRIIDKKVVLTKMGEIVNEEWLKTPSIRPNMNIILDEYCIMPNHFHGIIIFGPKICKDAMHRVSTTAPNNNNNGKDAMHRLSTSTTNNNNNGKDAMHCPSTSTPNNNNNGKDAMHCVSTSVPNNNNNGKDAMHCVSTTVTQNNHGGPSTYGPQRNNLGSVMRGFKSSCTKRIKIEIQCKFMWQERYYDIIIRNSKSYRAVQQYIINNPKKWKELY